MSSYFQNRSGRLHLCKQIQYDLCDTLFPKQRTSDGCAAHTTHGWRLRRHSRGWASGSTPRNNCIHFVFLSPPQNMYHLHFHPDTELFFYLPQLSFFHLIQLRFFSNSDFVFLIQNHALAILCPTNCSSLNYQISRQLKCAVTWIMAVYLFSGDVGLKVNVSVRRVGTDTPPTNPPTGYFVSRKFGQSFNVSHLLSRIYYRASRSAC